MLGVSSVWFVVEGVVLDVVDACADGELNAPARVLLERQRVAQAEATAEGGSAAPVVLDAEFAVDGEVVPSQAEVGAHVEAFVGLEVVAYLRLEDDAAEFQRLLEIVEASRVVERKGYGEVLCEGIFNSYVGVAEAEA